MPDNANQYSAAEIARHFDEDGLKEWNRLVGMPVGEISLHIHTHILQQYIQDGMRVLEIGAGAGRFTQVLAGLGARIVAADISPVQLELNQHHAEQFAFAEAVESWQLADICAMPQFSEASFDAVVAYGGPFSYVLDQRDAALAESVRVLRSGGLLLLSVMSMWGSARSGLAGVLGLPPAINQRITASGDLTAETFPGRKGNFMHMFRAAELRTWMEDAGLDVLAMSASGVLATGWDELLKATRQDAEHWQELLRMEVEASAEPASWNMGSHLIAVARRGTAGAF